MKSAIKLFQIFTTLLKLFYRFQMMLSRCNVVKQLQFHL